MKKRYRRDDLRMNGVSRHRGKRGKVRAAIVNLLSIFMLSSPDWEPAQPCAGRTCRETEIGRLSRNEIWVPIALQQDLSQAFD
jgi:hypothetical protein